MPAPLAYEIDPVSGCWEWTRARMKKTGYGVTAEGKRTFLAHRVSYEQARGPIPAGMQLDHLCRNRGCINPEHLEVVSQVENLRRGAGTKLTAEDVALVRSSSKSTYVLGRKLGIDPSHLSKIRRGLAWKDAA